MPEKPENPSDFQAAKQRDQQLNIRIDAELYEAANDKAAAYGLGPVIRAFLRAYVRGEVQLRHDDLLRELSAAPRKPRGRAARKRGHGG